MFLLNKKILKELKETKYLNVFVKNIINVKF